MIYRELGNTGIKVSEIGMGCEGFLDKTPEECKEYIDRMEQYGINCIDMYTPNPDFRSNLGYALKGRRENYILQAHIGSVWENGQYLRTRDVEKAEIGFQDQLNRLQTDYFDIGMIHYSDALDDWNTIKENGLLDYCKDLKEKGIIKAIGLSSHNPQVALDAVDGGHIDVLMFSVNPCYDLLPANEDVEELWNEENYAKDLVNLDPERQSLYEHCQEKGVGITVMKAFGGGDLLDASLSPAGVTLTSAQCIHYALTRPGVSTVMCGGRNLNDIDDAAAYENTTAEERDYAPVFASMPKISWKGHCMYCSHCAPCPKDISVADVTKFLNLTKAQGFVPETVREHYKVLDHHAEECVQCGSCEKRCPFEVGIIENMKKAVEVFGY